MSFGNNLTVPVKGVLLFCFVYDLIIAELHFYVTH